MIQPLNNNRGLTLIEVLVALGIGSIVLMAVTSMMSLLNSSNKTQLLNQTRNEIVVRIRNQALNFDNLKVSAQLTQSLGTAGVTPDFDEPNNIANYEMLAKCMPEVTEGAASGCVKTSMDITEKGFKFYLANSMSTDPGKATAGENIYYHANGSRCASDVAGDPGICPLQARVWFEPYCLNFATSCNKAMSLAVRYSVGARPGAKVSVMDLEGEVYVPVQKGIQLSRVLNQNDVPLTSNSVGIYAVKKFYGAEPHSGLRFEAVISNPTGLVSIKMQLRSLTGEAARTFDDRIVPPALEAQEWVDVVTPNNAALGPWSINLTNARPNQFLNFGTQMTVESNSRPGTSWTIGSADSSDSNYRWTKDPGTGDFKAPQFKSGIYQFRAVATDNAGNWIESTNYFTVRVIGRPEVLFDDPAPFSHFRDCESSTFNYRVLIGDDERVTENRVELDGVSLGVPNLGSTHGVLNIPFDTSKDPGNYNLKLTLKNPLSDVVLENGNTVASHVESRLIELKDVTASYELLTHNPAKLRIGSTGTVQATYRAGNCCNASPSVAWTYPAAFDGEPLLSSPATSTSSCSVAGNARVCHSEITVTGLKEGPLSANPPHNILGQLNFSASATSACNIPGSAPSNTAQSKYIPVVKNPTISLYLAESLWLKLPAGSIKATVPRVVVRADFAPEETVMVQVFKSSDSAVICDLEFPGSATPGGPIDRFCNIPAGYSGDLGIKKHPSYATKVQSELEPFTNSFKAKIAGNTVHRTCNAKIEDIPDQTLQHIVNSPLPMNDSPWNKTATGDQHPKNDTGTWTTGTAKQLRCYDNWSNFSASLNADNRQDYYSVYKYNTEDKAPAALPKNKGNFNLTFSNFVFPANPPFTVDPTSKNIPYFYAVYQELNPSSLVWGYSEAASGGASAISTPQGWEDVTAQVCSGTSTLSQIKLFRARMSVQSNSGNIIMKAANRIAATNSPNAARSYVFMCQYGRWHPSGSASVTWVD